MGLRVVFLGTSEFALPALRRLVESEHEVVGVYTQPDRPAGRGRHDKPSPVNELARQYDLPVHQPPRISAPQSADALVAAKPDVLVAAAYGQILSQPVLDVPPRLKQLRDVLLLDRVPRSGHHRRAPQRGQRLRVRLPSLLPLSSNRQNGLRRQTPWPNLASGAVAPLR